MNRFKKGDLVRFKRLPRRPCPLDDLLGIVMSSGEEETRLYGDGFSIEDYIDVLWFKDMKVQRYRGPGGRFEILSKELDK